MSVAINQGILNYLQKLTQSYKFSFSFCAVATAENRTQIMTHSYDACVIRLSVGDEKVFPKQLLRKLRP